MGYKSLASKTEWAWWHLQTLKCLNLLGEQSQIILMYSFRLLLGWLRGENKIFWVEKHHSWQRIATVHLHICKRERSKRMMCIQTADDDIQQENASWLKILLLNFNFDGVLCKGILRRQWSFRKIKILMVMALQAVISGTKKAPGFPCCIFFLSHIET